MTKQHTEDYKLSAVKYYIRINSLRKSYKKRKSIIINNILKFILKIIINNNPTIILITIKKEIKNKFDLDISKTYIYYIIKYKLKYTNKNTSLIYVCLIIVFLL
jgi:hypothetical protein